MEKLVEKIGIGTIIFCLLVIGAHYLPTKQWIDVARESKPLMGITAIWAIIAVLGLYFFPSLIGRRKKDGLIIFLINIFSASTVLFVPIFLLYVSLPLGWFVALIWAMKSAPKGDNIERIRDPKTGRFLSGTLVSIFLCLLLLVPAASFAEKRFVPLDMDIYPIYEDGSRSERPFPIIETGQSFDLSLTGVAVRGIFKEPFAGVLITKIIVIVSNLAQTMIFYRFETEYSEWADYWWMKTITIDRGFGGGIYRVTVKYRINDGTGSRSLETQSCNLLVNRE